MSTSGFPLGLPHLGVIDLPAALGIQAAIQGAAFGITGNIFYLDPVNGLDTNLGTTPTTALQSLPAAYNLLRSGYNDTILLLSNGATTSTARIHTAFTWSKNAAHLIGIGAPSATAQWARLAPTGTDTAFANFFTVSGNGCFFQNLQFWHGFNAGVAASICLTVTGQANAFINCHFEGMGDATGATSSTSRCILLSGAGATDNYFGHCGIGTDTIVRTGANASIELIGGPARTVFENCFLPIWSSDGNQFFLLVAGASGMDRWVLFKGCMATSFVGGTVVGAFASLAGSCGGILILDSTTGLYNVTAIGAAGTKAQTFVSGATSLGGVRGIVAS